MKNGKFFSLLVLIFLVGGYAIYKVQQQPKVAVVDFQKVVMDFDGMVDAMATFEEKAKGWENEIDSLQQVLNLMVNDLQTNTYETEVVIQRESQLRLMNNYILSRNQEISKLAQEEDAKLTGAVMLQITDFIDEYAIENGYDIVYGKNDGNYVLYHSGEFDITEDLLTGLNKMYNGE